MMPAKINPWFDRTFRLYTRWYLLRRQFHSISLRGEMECGQDDAPVLYIMNHSSWWDGLLVYFATRSASRRRHLMMMDEKQLQKYRFFRNVGAFSIDKTSMRGIVESLCYAAAMLKQGADVWIFPQGDIYHPETRPLRFQSGVGYLLEHCPQAIVCPVTAYYTFCMDQKVDATLWFGEPIRQDWRALGRRGIAGMLQEQLEAQLNAHRAQVIRVPRSGPGNGFSPILRTVSIDQRFDVWKREVSRWTSYFGDS